MAYHEWLSDFVVNAYNDNLSLVSPTRNDVISIPQQHYYIKTHNNDSANGILSMLQNVIANIADYANATCNHDPSTGKIQIHFHHANHVNISWLDTPLQSLLGYTGSQTSSNSYTAEHQPRYMWRPSLEPSSYPTDEYNLLEPASGTMVHVSPTGRVYGVEGSEKWSGVIEYPLLPAEDVLVMGRESNNRDLLSFLRDSAHKARSVRLLLNREQYTNSDDYLAVIIGEDEKAQGAFSSRAKRRIKSYNGLFDVTIPVVLDE